MFQIKFRGTICEITLRWIPHNPFDDKLTWLGEVTKQAITVANFIPAL